METFDGHLSFRTTDGRRVLVCYQVKHTRISEENVSKSAWGHVESWLIQARSFMDGYDADLKVFVVITNNEVHPVPSTLDEDFILIHAGNIGLFLAPCLLAAASLARDDLDL